MALDAQRNWNLMMAENLEKILGNERASSSVQTLADQTVSLMISDPVAWTSPPIHLPDEIIIAIIEHVAQLPQAQRTLASCCRLSLQWYQAAVPLLYARPHLYGKNFDPFVKAICPSINLHVRVSPLAGLVKRLDMSNLVHQGSKSITARLLGRVKKQIEEFVAPQASFNISCFPALAGCKNLRLLDLSLVSESPPLPDLFRAISNLQKLTTFLLPRSSGFGRGLEPSTLSWPPNIRNLHLSGGIDTHFLHGAVAFPQSLHHLTIERCPMAKGSAINYLLQTAVRALPHLRSLKLAHLTRLRENTLSDVLAVLPYLHKLSISVDYIGPDFFDYSSASHRTLSTLKLRHDNPPFAEPDSSYLPPIQVLPPQMAITDPDWYFTNPPHAHLRVLELTSSGNPGVEDHISPIDVLLAIDEGHLPFLRQVFVDAVLKWEEGETGSEVLSLTEALRLNISKRAIGNDLDRLDGEVREEYRSGPAGVYIVD